MVLEYRSCPLLKDGRPSFVALWSQGGGGFRMRREECNALFLVPYLSLSVTEDEQWAGVQLGRLPSNRLPGKKFSSVWN